MSDRPIPPVDPIARTTRVAGSLRHVEAADASPAVDAAMRQEWQDALARELLKAKDEAERRRDGGALRRWRELVRSLWPREGSAEGGAPKEPRQER
ncbi:hypothetical protein [Salinarimonas soli]|uniref:Uncharacterized protein n=1 Tax=Salinarimonas soli TaxID=1638099 RepID=A0A5B2VEI9_9HYPH|nr:hypothetical protein [Salinarimonas soli]KAA2237394.1 hypothetical protein F0L46_10365 [Salinarimonas soli]